MSKKQIIERIFNICRQKNNFVFDNSLVRDVVKKIGANTNPYDMTKIDDISKLPESVVLQDYFIVHLGNGKHKFVKGIEQIYHLFEDIEKNEIIQWRYRPSVLNDFSISESAILSLVNNHRILHDFLYQDYVGIVPKMYNSERKRGVSFEYFIGKEKLSFDNLQIEIDMTLEYDGYVSVFEGKNTAPNKWLKNFNAYQLYNPFRYYYDLKQNNKLNIKKLTACYLVRQKSGCGDSIVRLYNYTFDNPLDITSIRLLKKRQYNLKRKGFEND
jgi:hypothetical protein